MCRIIPLTRAWSKGGARKLQKQPTNSFLQRGWVHAVVWVLQCVGDVVTWSRCHVDYVKEEKKSVKVKKMNLKKTYFKSKLVTWQLCHIIVYCCTIFGVGVQRYVAVWWWRGGVLCRFVVEAVGVRSARVVTRRCLGSTNMVTWQNYLLIEIHFLLLDLISLFT